MKRTTTPAMFVILGSLQWGCGEPAPPPGALSLVRFPYEAFPIPATNNPTPERVELGRLLFFDPVLSANRKVACGSCHLPDKGMSDGLAVSRALGDPQGGFLTRASMTIFNVRFQHAFFWDGRAATLEDLVSAPIENERELASSLPQALAAVSSIPEYVDKFQEAYGTQPDESSLRRAIAAFLREITANEAPVDRYLAGDSQALGPEASAGFNLFFGKARCSRCHYLPLFAGTEGPSFIATEFRVTGVPERGKKPAKLTEDPGRGGITKEPELLRAFKAPTLRNIRHTAPYMHNGVFETLEEVVEFYDKGAGPGMGYPVAHLDFVLRPGPLKLSAEERRQLVTFLKEGLLDLGKTPTVPDRVPSGLRPNGG